MPIHELGHAPDGTAYFTMKLVKGKSLADILSEMKKASLGRVAQPPSAVSSPEAGGTVAQPRAAVPHNQPSLGDLLQVFLKICDGVAFAHSRGVIHRDLKPANIMVGDYGEVLVMDWGLAKIVKQDDRGQMTENRGPEEGQRVPPTNLFVGASGAEAPKTPSSELEGGTRETATRIVSDRQDITALQTLAGSMMGTPAYMSPEQAKGELDHIDARSDIWSLGAILYEILTLERAIPGETTYAILASTLKGNIVPPEQRAPTRNVPRELSAIAMKCLHKGRAHRYRSVLDLKRDLTLFLEGRSVSASPDTFSQATVKLIKRNKGVSAAVAAAAVVLIAVTTVFVVRLATERNRAVASEGRAVTNEKAAVAARDAQRATALAASRRQAESAVRAASEGRLDEAKVRADAAVEVMPDGPWGYYALGMIARERSDFRSSRQHLEKALRLDSSHIPASAALSALSHQEGDVAKALVALKDLEGLRDWRTAAAIGGTLSHTGRYKDAVVAYERALALAEKDATARQAAIDEIKYQLGGVLADIACVGFYDSIRALPLEDQKQRINRKLAQTHGQPVSAGFTAENDAIVGVYFPEQPVRWLAALRGVPLASLAFRGSSQLRDLSPLKGMPLVTLSLNGCSQVSDLSPLAGMPLTNLDLYGCGQVRDLTPLRGLPLASLILQGCADVTDLSPLKGMPLRSLNLVDCRQVTDLSPLDGMPLTELNLYSCGQVRDLSPLRGAPITTLVLNACGVTDLDPLRGMPLQNLGLAVCGEITDLSPLKDTPLKGLDLQLSTRVSDLSPLKGMSLTRLTLGGCPSITDVRPLEGMRLETLTLSPQNIKRGLDILRSMKSLKTIGLDHNQLIPAEEFWRKYDAGEFSK